MIRSSLLVLAIALAPARAFADAKTDAKADAKVHIDKASVAHAAGKLVDALAELNIAYTLDPQPELLYAIAQVHVQLGQCPQAITFYRRFLATHPPDEAVEVVTQAIHTCETAPPPAVETKPQPPPELKPEPPPQSPPPTPTPIAVDRPPFYTDILGDALVGGGLVAGVVGAITYTMARSALDDAGKAATYDESKQLVDRAHSRRTLSIGLEVGAGVLIGAGIVHYMLHRSSDATGVAVVPAHGGGIVSWSGRF